MKDINIFAFADEVDSSIDVQIEAMKKNGLNGLEIRGVDGENVSDISLKKAKEVKEKLDNNNLITWSIGSPIGKINIHDDFSEHIEKLKHTLEIAKTLETENVRIFSFYIPKEDIAENHKNQVIEYLGKMCEVAKPYNINLCHENEKGIYGDIPERCLEIHKALPVLKGVFDPANYVQRGVDTLKAWEMLKNHIYYMHIKDAKKNGFVVPAGCGDGNFKIIVKDFLNNGGRNFTMEPHLTVFEGLSALENEGEKSAIQTYKYSSSKEAFKVACDTFRELLSNL